MPHPANRPEGETNMKIQYLGHAAFAITTKSGKVIITDPYESGGFDGAVGYKKITVKPDIVTVSHPHADHNDVKSLAGKPQVIDKPGDYDIGEVKIKGISVYHDTAGGKERGKNLIFIYEADGLRLAHLGDLGHKLTPEQLRQLGRIDIVMIPVGGYFTIEAETATEVINQIKPSVTVPMHYKTEVLNFPIASVDVFLRDKKNVKRFNSSEVTVDKGSLPAEPEVWVLPYTK